MRLSIYYLIIIFLISLLFLGSLSFGASAVFAQAVPPLAAAIIADTLLKYFKLKKMVISPSPVITGLIIGLVAQFGEIWWKLALTSSLAIAIKFLVRMDGRHIFNPAGAGLLLGMLLLSSHPSWWVGGGAIWPYFIWIAVLSLRFKRWAPIAGFLIPVVVLSGFNILISGSLLFFISVMLIEPKTSPFNIKLGLIYGLIVGVGYILLSQVNLDLLIISLLIGNLGARLFAKAIESGYIS